ncbi:hypothetical protein [Deinococcus multiflagellatus]|uniref:Uncharacterized protein n=1 Tax=Deinococcus multiflagellatus TaxID=1656887 RepID=A0ABW1ZIW9_9DEIO|nr:hypothetical protein [Deinococcus multiflagellatus]MBZ9712071.1 hypothetical protein [Deinococcus multiflagellatus]
MTGRHSDESPTRPEEHHSHSDAESLRHVPHHISGVRQDSPGTQDIGVEHGEPNRQKDPDNDRTNDG